MARSTLAIYSGTIPVSTSDNPDQTKYYQVFDIICKHLTGTLSTDGQSAWQIAETIVSTTGSRDRVYHSVGDRSLGSGELIGDTDIWWRIQETVDDLKTTTYQDWSPTSSTTSTSFTANPGGARASASTTQAQLTNIDEGAEIKWWMAVNEYCFIFVQQQAANGMQIIGADCPRDRVQAGYDGVARIQTATTGSGTVTIVLDRNLSGTVGQTNTVQAGQKIWLISQTPDNNSLTTEVSEIATVSSVQSDNKINLTGVTNTYPSGSLVGIDANNTFCFLMTSSPDPTLYGFHRPDAGFSAAASQTADYEWPVSVDLARSSPTNSGFIPLYRVVLNSDQSAYTGFRGISNMVFFSGVANVNDGDSAALLNNNVILFFPSMKTSAGGFMLAIGPGVKTTL